MTPPPLQATRFDRVQRRLAEALLRPYAQAVLSKSVVSGALVALSEHPEQWAALRAQPERIPLAVEEALRWTTPVTSFLRTATRDVEVHGETIRAGEPVLLVYAAANRDERHFENPDALDLDRPNSRSQIGFGAGVHFCLGAPLARRELAIGFRAFVDHIDDFELIDPNMSFEYQKNFALRALTSLPIRFTKKK